MRGKAITVQKPERYRLDPMVRQFVGRFADDYFVERNENISLDVDAFGDLEPPFARQQRTTQINGQVELLEPLSRPCFDDIAETSGRRQGSMRQSKPKFRDTGAGFENSPEVARIHRRSDKSSSPVRRLSGAWFPGDG